MIRIGGEDVVGGGSKNELEEKEGNGDRRETYELFIVIVGLEFGIGHAGEILGLVGVGYVG